jgi:hypothetical protein
MGGVYSTHRSCEKYMLSLFEKCEGKTPLMGPSRIRKDSIWTETCGSCVWTKFTWLSTTWVLYWTFAFREVLQNSWPSEPPLASREELHAIFLFHVLLIVTGITCITWQSSGILHRVLWWKFIDVSEVITTSIIRADRPYCPHQGGLTW